MTVVVLRLSVLYFCAWDKTTFCAYSSFVVDNVVLVHYRLGGCYDRFSCCGCDVSECDADAKDQQYGSISNEEDHYCS